MIKVVSGYSDPGDEVYVIRWEHGELHGWVKLDPQDDSASLSRDLSIPVDLSRAPGVEDASGWLVVAMHILSDTPGTAYDVRIEEQFTLRKADESRTMSFKSCRGTLLRVPPDIDADNQESRKTSSYGLDHVELTKFQDGQSISWLELRLPSTAQTNAEQSDVPERE